METLSHATLKDADEVSCSRFRNASAVSNAPHQKSAGRFVT
jgi:hypothetical protein